MFLLGLFLIIVGMCLMVFGKTMIIDIPRILMTIGIFPCLISGFLLIKNEAEKKFLKYQA